MVARVLAIFSEIENMQRSSRNGTAGHDPVDAVSAAASAAVPGSQEPIKR
jgi:hypothetical protein